jgi:DNA-binding GntR family transcriptional regulator
MSREQCRYLRIADALRMQIEGGLLQPGDKVPTMRVLASQHSVHPDTAARGLQALEAQGLIWRCPGLGYYVKRRALS